MEIIAYIDSQEYSDNPEIAEIRTEGSAGPFSTVYCRKGVEIAARRLPDGWGIAACNHDEEPRIVYIDFQSCGLSGVYRVRNIRKREDQGFAEREIPVIIESNDCALFRLISLS